MRLIIAEKHSVGQAIAQAVGGHMEKHDGYVQVGDDLVTWAQGHLFLVKSVFRVSSLIFFGFRHEECRPVVCFTGCPSCRT